MTARVDETEVDAAEAILNQHGPINTASRLLEYEASGWSSFNDEDDAEVMYERPMGDPKDRNPDRLLIVVRDATAI